MSNGIDGLDALLAGMQHALTGQQLQACTDAAAAPILAEVEQRVPVRTGQLKAHLGTASHHTATQATTAVQVADSGPGGQAHEAIFLEYGTSHAAAEPFMRPGFEAGRQAALDAFTNQLQHQIGQAK